MKYRVIDGKQKTKPISAQQVLRLYKTGRLSVDARVIDENSKSIILTRFIAILGGKLPSGHDPETASSSDEPTGSSKRHASIPRHDLPADVESGLINHVTNSEEESSVVVRSVPHDLSDSDHVLSRGIKQRIVNYRKIYGAILIFVIVIITVKWSMSDAKKEEYRKAALVYFDEMNNGKVIYLTKLKDAQKEYIRSVQEIENQRKLQSIGEIGNQRGSSLELRLIQSEIKRSERELENLELDQALIAKKKTITLDWALTQSQLFKQLGDVQARLNIDDTVALEIRENVKTRIAEEAARQKQIDDSFQ